MSNNKGEGVNNESENKNHELIFKKDGQEYAQVTKVLDNGNLEAMCFDGAQRLCHISDKLRNTVWLKQSDIILIGLRDYQDSRADVIMKYSSDEARNLKAYGELPVTAIIDGGDIGDSEDKNSHGKKVDFLVEDINLY